MFLTAVCGIPIAKWAIEVREVGHPPLTFSPEHRRGPPGPGGIPLIGTRKGPRRIGLRNPILTSKGTTLGWGTRLLRKSFSSRTD
jgi:hypothetical protein